MAGITIKNERGMARFISDNGGWKTRRDRQFQRELNALPPLKGFAFQDYPLPSPMHQYAKEIAVMLNGEVVSIDIEDNVEGRVY